MHRPAILVDRDGVLVEEVAFLSRPDQVRALPGVGAAIQRAHRAGFRVEVCTNQPVVARGEVTLDGLDAIHRTLDAQLRTTGDAPDAYRVCPHHPDPDAPNPARAFVTACDCRKPLPGLLLQAAREGGLTPASTVYVGDRTTDLLAAQRAGMVGVGVTTGYACRDGKHPLLPEVPLFPTLADAFTLPLVTAGSPTLRALAAQVEDGSVVRMGGASRAGKTVLCNALRLALSHLGKRVVHVSLDRFITPASRRPADATLEVRLGHAHAQAFVDALLRTGRASTPQYDPSTREDAGTTDVHLPDGAVLLLDGILANTLDVARPNHRIHVDARAELRRARRVAFYAWKGLSGAPLDHSVDGRTDEEARLPALRAHAQHHWTLHTDGTVDAVTKD